jgi:membrane protease YdiL (CAAX protease family)
VAEEGSRSAEESTPGSPGIVTSVLTLGALFFALVTIARSNEWVWTHPYLSRDEPVQTIYLGADYERRVARVWPEGLPGGPASRDDIARVFEDFGEEVWRTDRFSPSEKQDFLEETTLALRVLSAGSGDGEALAKLRSANENDFPDYLRPRLREILRGDTAADYARALVGRGWHASALLSEVLAMAAASLALVLLLKRRRLFVAGGLPTKPVVFGLAQGWVVISWSFAALALAWRLSWADVPLLSELLRAFPSLILALVAYFLVRDTRASQSPAPLASLLSLSSDSETRRNWFLLGMVVLGTSFGFALVVDAAVKALGGRTSWGEFLIEPLIHGSSFQALACSLELVVFAPFGEELLFRGVLFGALASKLSPHRAAIVAALVFSAWHAYGLVGSLLLAVDGYLLALLYWRTRSLVPGMVVHAALNAVVCLNNFGCRI